MDGSAGRRWVDHLADGVVLADRVVPADGAGSRLPVLAGTDRGTQARTGEAAQALNRVRESGTTPRGEVKRRRVFTYLAGDRPLVPAQDRDRCPQAAQRHRGRRGQSVLRHALCHPEGLPPHEVHPQPRKHLRPVGAGGGEADGGGRRVHRQRDGKDQEDIDDDGPDEVVQPVRRQVAGLHGELRDGRVVGVPAGRPVSRPASAGHAVRSRAASPGIHDARAKAIRPPSR